MSASALKYFASGSSLVAGAAGGAAEPSACAMLAPSASAMPSSRALFIARPLPSPASLLALGRRRERFDRDVDAEAVAAVLRLLPLVRDVAGVVRLRRDDQVFLRHGLHDDLRL